MITIKSWQALFVAAALLIAGALFAHASPYVPAVNADMGCPDSTGDYLTGSSSAVGCANFQSAVQTVLSTLGYDPVLSGTTGSIGGSPLIATCTTGTVTISGVTTGMVATTNPTTYPGVNVQWQAYVSSANTVTVSVCSSGLTLTPTATPYKVRVWP